MSVFPTVETLLAACAEYRAKLTQVECENAALREDKELLDLLNTHCMSADPIMGRSTYRWTIEHDEPDIRVAINAARAKEGGAT